MKIKKLFSRKILISFTSLLQMCLGYEHDRTESNAVRLKKENNFRKNVFKKVRELATNHD